MHPKTRSYILGAVMIMIGVFVVGRVSMAAYRWVSDFDPKDLVFAAGTDLMKDEHGYTNILLLGDGGHERDGADLIDTIMVASIDYDKNAVSLLSIPRDFYVKADGETVKYSGRINELYRNHKYDLPIEADRFRQFMAVAGDVVDLQIHYFARVDFKAFVEVVDSLGGVTVDVEEAIYDPYYPNETDDGYTIFSIKSGEQEMNGETALKFVRSRKTTSDFDRAARQQKVLEAIQQKALSKDILTSPGTLKDIYNSVSKNVNTNLSLREMIELGKFAKDFDRSRLVRKVLHDDPGQEGGFLVTPDRDFYNGQFVLVPFGTGYDLVHRYADLIFHDREIYFDPATIEVLNATRIPGIARNSAYQLNRYGFNIVNIDNFFDNSGDKKYLEESVIYYYDYTEDKDGTIHPTHQSTLDALEKFVKGVPLPAPDAMLVSEEKGKKVYAGQGIKLSIVLGDDYDVFLVN
jgi:LCP family protein required for cell wall assembly